MPGGKGRGGAYNKRRGGRGSFYTVNSGCGPGGHIFGCSGRVIRGNGGCVNDVVLRKSNVH